MATQTLLTMVQNILAAMSSDEVNSIGDTVESMQVAQIIQNKYYDIVARGDLRLDEQIFQLNPSDNPAIPVSMYLPAGVSRISWMQYFDSNPLDNITQKSQFGSYSHDLNTDLVSSINWSTISSTSNTIGQGTKLFTVASASLPITVGQTAQAANGANTMFGTVSAYQGTTLTMNITQTTGQGTFNFWTITNVATPAKPPGYRYITLLDNSEFLDMVNKLDITQPNVQSYTFTQAGNNYTFRYQTDRQPSWATVISNFFVLFDAYDKTQDVTLQASKTMVMGQIVPSFQLKDSFIPTLNDQQFPLLLNESKALAFFELKQMPHSLADRELKRQWTSTQKNKSIDNKPSYFDQLPNFGRFAVGPWLNYRYGTRWTRSGAFPW